MLHKANGVSLVAPCVYRGEANWISRLCKAQACKRTGRSSSFCIGRVPHPAVWSGARCWARFDNHEARLLLGPRCVSSSKVVAGYDGHDGTSVLMISNWMSARCGDAILSPATAYTTRIANLATWSMTPPHRRDCKLYLSYL